MERRSALGFLSVGALDTPSMNRTYCRLSNGLWAVLLLSLCLLQSGIIKAAEPRQTYQESAQRFASAVILRNPQSVRRAFETTGSVSQDQGVVPFPALVSDKLFIRGFDISPTYDPQAGDRDHVLKTYALGRAGIGRWFVFTGGHDLVERVLVSGQYGASQVFKDLGFGSGFQCQPDHFYWLVVFQQGAGMKPMPAVYENLQPWFRHVYPQQAPVVEGDTIKSLAAQRFGPLTGCPVDEQGYFDSPRDLDRCHPDFTQVVKAAWASNRCTNPNALRYTPSQGCPTDQVLQQLGRKPDAQRLRAYLFAVNSFTEFYTGYGYTAASYNQPIGREFWVDNSWIRNLPKVELLRVQCNLPAGRAQSLTPVPNSVSRSSLVDQY